MQQADIQDLINTAAHDLKSPLRRIISYCAMLREDAAPRLKDAEINMLSRIETNTVRMQALVENLTLMMRLQCMPRTIETTDIEKILRNTSLDIPELENETRTLNIAVLPHIPANPRELKILFTHLLKNAQLYSSPNHPLNINITAQQQDDQIIITFADNGLGIAPEFQEEIMTPFKRLHAQDDIEGSGLGLAICQQIAALHNATLSLNSTEHKGSTLTLTIPIPKTD